MSSNFHRETLPLTTTSRLTDEYLRHVLKLPLILNKDHCVWNGMKWIHDQSKPMSKVEMSADPGAQVDTIGPQNLVKLGLCEGNCSGAPWA